MGCRIVWSKDEQGRLVASLVAPGGSVIGKWVQGLGVQKPVKQSSYG
ncbi:unnamed protein product [marine sediment metagenome]|uniref:Uncharacterized protein n=1 Tax=marine sediment metagenome TaxID=412755 RepID=X0VNW6_9ZZZZ